MEAKHTSKGDLQLLKKRISVKREQAAASAAEASADAEAREELEGKSVAAAADSSEATTAATAAPTATAGSSGHWKVTWTCAECARQCIPVRTESRCLCGHRYKEHKPVARDDSGETASEGAAAPRFACQARNCRCNHFFFIVAEGAWILRCRCKHKHTDHDPATKPHVCTKPRCACEGFDSPWVCNCGHAWAMHQQHTSYVNTPNSALFAATMAAAGVDVTPEMMAVMMEGMPDIATIDQCRPDGLP